VRNTLAYCYVTGENTLAFCVNVSDEEKSFKTLTLEAYTLRPELTGVHCKGRLLPMTQLLSEWLTVRNTLAYYYVTGENTLAFCVNVSDEEKSLKH
jgi:hypothetical protein